MFLLALSTIKILGKPPLPGQMCSAQKKGQSPSIFVM